MAPYSAIDRFMEKISPCPITGCWLWMAYWDKDDYPRFRHNGEMRGAHRFAWSMIGGNPLPVWPMTIDHKCGVRCCVNPDHLQTLHIVENSLKGSGYIYNKRMRLLGEDCPHCGNRYSVQSGRKKCITCKRAYDRLRYRKEKG